MNAEAIPELAQLQALILRAGDSLRSEVVCEVGMESGDPLPVYCIEMGSKSPEVPAVGFFGGIHGVERIGTQVVLSFLHTLVERLRWDVTLEQQLRQLRLVFMPLVNPGGMFNRTRCNPNGVDLMRNAPVDAEGRVPFLLGGQRLTRHLPWYRGRAGGPMQTESAALCRVVAERLLPHSFSLALDCHSGFGTRDRIWFPYARTYRPIDCLSDIFALRSLFRVTHPNHSIYVIEPQSRHYTTHGDLWDHLYDQSKTVSPGLFMPFTLELGSWLWVKKNPLQIFNALGLYNPLLPHRERRILRQHLVFMEFLVRAAISHERWRPATERRHELHDSALQYWYGRDQATAARRA